MKHRSGGSEQDDLCEKIVREKPISREKLKSQERNWRVFSVLIIRNPYKIK